MTPWPAWLRLGLVLPLVGLNAFVLKRVLVQFAPFPIKRRLDLSNLRLGLFMDTFAFARVVVAPPLLILLPSYQFGLVGVGLDDGLHQGFFQLMT